MSAIRGKTKIELTDVNTGKVKTVVHKNMVTSAPSDLLRSERGELATIMKHMANGDYFATALFGGLFLFSDELSTDEDEYFLPTLNVTGFATQEAYTGYDYAKGSFNISASGLQPDGKWKFVWDFTELQANGTIKSVALAPKRLGDIGISDTIVYDAARGEAGEVVTGGVFNGGNMLPSGTTAGINNGNFIIVAVIDDFAYAVNIDNVYKKNNTSIHITENGGILKLYKFKLGVTDVALNNIGGQGTYINEVDIELPSEFVAGLDTSSGNESYTVGFQFEQSVKKLIVYPCHKAGSIAVNGTAIYAVINMNDMTVDSGTFTNRTPGSISRDGVFFNDSIYHTSLNLWLNSDYALSLSYVDSAYRLYVTKLSDNTVKQVRMGANPFAWNGEAFFSPLIIRDNIMVVRMRRSYMNHEWPCYIIDLASGVIKGTYISVTSYSDIIDVGSDTVFVATGGNLRYAYFMNPFLLTTKNNLESPVTKTTSQIMKVTYTLEQA